MQYKVFGCKVNKYYTDRWLNSQYLRDKTGTFVASCVVTDSAKRKWIRFVKKELELLSGNGKIFISGCGAFKNGKAQDNFFILYPDLSPFQDKIEVLDEAPIEDKQKVEKEIKEIHSEKKKESKIDLSKLKSAQKTQIYTKKFILIQGGCDSFCTFCLTVQKR
jgi:tRNA A37 methylthiotransferase MiaB